MAPPGLALATVSPAAWERCERASLPRFYFDWRRYRRALENLSTPFTPAVSTVAALDVALGVLLEEGLEAAFARHAALGRACREGAKSMGLELFSPDEERSAVVTAILAPEEADARELTLALRQRFRITVTRGHGDLRLAPSSGSATSAGTTSSTSRPALAAVELVLSDLGAPIERGVAVTRALEAYAEHVTS